MPITLSHFYIVLTYKHVGVEITPDHVIDFCQNKFFNDRYIIIKEFGKNGDNPHYNIVVSSDASSYRDDNIVNSLRSSLFPKSYIKTKNDIIYKAAQNIPNLVCGYLSKEDSAQIIFNNGFDLQKLSDECIVVKTSAVQYYHTTLTKYNAVPLILRFSNDNNLDPNTGIKDIIKQMMLNGFNFQGILNNIAPIVAEVRLCSGDDSYLCQYIDSKLMNALAK